MPAPIASADFRVALVAELRIEWRTSHFWIAVAMHSIPVIGVIFFEWPALKIGVYFVIQSWLMLALYCATDLTFDPKYRANKPPRGLSEGMSDFIKNLVGALLIVGILLGVVGGLMLQSSFAGDAWNTFIHSGWHERSFLNGLAALAAGCMIEALRFVRSLPRRTMAQIEADDMRIATTFYRVVLLFTASFLINVLGVFGFADVVFVMATALVLTYFEVLPRSAASLIGILKNKPA